jgi:hypothetical protein
MRPKMKILSCFLALAGAFALIGCSTYITPGAKADLQIFAPPDIQAAFAVQPTKPFPASVAVVRVQAPRYSNYNLERNGGQFGGGRYSIVLSREAGEDTQIDRLTGLPGLNGVVALNRMLLPPELQSDAEIRAAAARLHADLVLLYTFDTTFRDHNAATALSVITLGLSPTRKIIATTTASALLVDTRTGYVYSAYEVTERKETLATSWGSADSADAARRETEKNAFGKLIGEIASSWPKLVAAR